MARRVLPEYPADARAEGIAGRVLLEVEIAEDGAVASVEVVESSGDRRLDRVAEEAVRQWAFTPAMLDGVPLRCRVRVPVTFRLREIG